MTETLRIIPGGADIIPFDVEVEQQLLGCLLLDQKRIGPVISRGGKDLFYDSVHQSIFSEMAERDRQGALVSPVSISRSQALVGKLGEVGGPQYLVRLAGAAIQSGFQNAIDILAEVRSRRDLLSVVRSAQSALVAGNETVSDVAARLEVAASVTSLTSTAAQPVSMMKAATIALEQVYSAYSGEEPHHVRSGISALDQMISGFYPGDMVLLGGRPSMGKTAVALSMGLNAARAGHPIIFASLEMTPESMALRAMSEATGGIPSGAVSYSAARRGNISERQMDNLTAATKEVANLPIYFLPREFAEGAALVSGVKRVLSRYQGDKLPLVIVDYLQLMRHDGASRYEKITAISQDIKDTAMRMECPVLALSQLSRQVEQRDDKRPLISDLRESGQLEQDADTIMFCYRPEYYLQKEEPDVSDAEDHEEWRAAMDRVRNRLEISVAKQRQGETGVARVRFNPALNYIWED